MMNITWNDIYKWIQNSNPNRQARVIVADMDSSDVYANCCMDEDNYKELKIISLKYEICTVDRIEKTIEAYLSTQNDVYGSLDDDVCFYNDEADKIVFRKNDRPIVKVTDNFYVFRGRKEN